MLTLFLVKDLPAGISPSEPAGCDFANSQCTVHQEPVASVAVLSRLSPFRCPKESFGIFRYAVDVLSDPPRNHQHEGLTTFFDWLS